MQQQQRVTTHSEPVQPALPAEADSECVLSTFSRAGGFTLLEVLVVVVILAIGFAVVMPKIYYMSEHQRVDRMAQVVASDIRSAFTSAARGRVPVRLSVPVSATQYTITNTVTGATIVKRTFGSGDVRVQGMNATAVTLDVYPNGIASGADTVTVMGGTYSRKVSVSRVGFVRVL